MTALGMLLEPVLSPFFGIILGLSGLPSWVTMVGGGVLLVGVGIVATAPAHVAEIQIDIPTAELQKQLDGGSPSSGFLTLSPASRLRARSPSQRRLSRVMEGGGRPRMTA